jgi:hypothetical protein
VAFEEPAYSSMSRRKSGLCSYFSVSNYFSVAKIIKHSGY